MFDADEGHDPDDAALGELAAAARAGAPADEQELIRFERDQIEFGRAINFFDATFAIATTLLVTTLATGKDQWVSWSAFRSAAAGPLFAFVLSFVVVSTFWWANHRFISSLATITPRIIGVTVVMLGFVVLLPFSTAGLGQTGAQVATVVYALNVAAASIANFVLYRIALDQGLFVDAPSREEAFERTITILDTPVVFLLTVPVALAGWPGAAKYLWLLLVPLAFVEARWFKRRRSVPG